MISDLQKQQILCILKEVYQQGYICGICDDSTYDEYLDYILNIIEINNEN